MLPSPSLQPSAGFISLRRFPSVTKRFGLLGLALCGAWGMLSQTTARASALSLDFSGDVPDADYKDLITPIVNPTRFQAIAPASPTGIIGFDVGLGATFFAVPQRARDIAKSYVKDGGDLPASLIIPRLLAQKGLPFGLDVGVNFAAVPGSDFKLIGGMVQYAAFNGPSPLPSVAIRAAYDSLVGLKELQSSTTSLEAVVSVGLPPVVTLVEPYAGAGISFANAKSDIEFQPAELPGTTAKVNKEAKWSDRYFLAGVRLSVLPFIGISGEAQFSGIQTLYNAKLSLRF